MTQKRRTQATTHPYKGRYILTCCTDTGTECRVAEEPSATQRDKNENVPYLRF